MDEIFVSIILPVYNVEKYLKDCINSILGQLYSSFELIIVDDGSTDSSGTICDTYINQDSRVKVFHKQNGGLSDARNFGINKAIGEYYTFIDSDDYIGSHYLTELVKMIKKYNVNLSIVKFGKNGRQTIGKSYLIDTKEAEKNMLLNKYYGFSACAKLYHKSLFSDICFPKDKLYEDMRVMPFIINKCNKIAYSESEQYFVNERIDSITRRPLRDEDYSLIEGYYTIHKFLKSNYPDLLEAWQCRFVNDTFTILIHRIIYEKDYKYKLHKLVKKYKNIYIKGITNKYLSFNKKIQTLLVLCSPRLYKRIYIFIDKVKYRRLL